MDRTWLIDTGSEKNYITPSSVPDGSKIKSEEFFIRTPTGREKGTYTVLLNISPMIGFDKELFVKFHIFNFSNKYNILLGFETMKELNVTINCQKDEIIMLRDIKIINGKIKYNSSPKTKPISDQIIPDELHYTHNVTNIKGLIRHEHIDVPTKHKLFNLLEKYPSMIKHEDEPLRATDLLKHRITLKTDKPIYSRNYRYPNNFKEHVKQEIDKLLQANIIRKSNSPYNSPIWVVPKKLDASGTPKVRMVIDYRKLNQETVPDKFPLPNIEDLLNKLKGSRYFTTIDLASGFHQIELEEDSIAKTAFSTEQGHYEFMRLPFGLCNAPPTFQRAMNTMLENVSNALVYVDDIIIFSRDIESHLHHLEDVFRKLCQHSLTIQLDKTEFFKTELPFLGHIVSSDGLKPQPDKIKAVLDFPVPTTDKEIRQFLGLTGYYRRFIHNYAHIAKPLTQALRTESFAITDQFQSSVQTLKDILTNAPVLQFPNWDLPFTLTTDASNVALGAVLSQLSEGKDHPIAFASRTLSQTEQKYSTIEKELLAVVWACTHFKPYLYGKRFTLHTDHKPLTWIFTMKNANNRLMKWVFQLSDFEFDIKHIEGKTNFVADALSRNPIEPTDVGLHAIEQDTDIDPQLELEKALEEAMETNTTPDYDGFIEQLLDNQTDLATVHSQESSNQQVWIMEDDKPINIQKHQIFIQRGSSPTITTRPFKKFRYTMETAYPWQQDLESKLLEILKPNTTYGLYCEPNIETVRPEYEGIFNAISQIVQNSYPTVKIKRFKKKCLDIENEQEQLDLINSYHLGKTYHRGGLETYGKLKRYHYFPKMKDIIIDYVNKCDTCRRVKYDRRPIKTKYCLTPTPIRPFDEIMIDTLHYAQKYIITLADTFSKRLFTRLTDTLNAHAIMQVLIDYFEHFPPPTRIKMDNGREYKNGLIENFLSTQGIEAYYTTPNHPNSLGLLNRIHSTLLEILRSITDKQPNENLITKLKLATNAYNNTMNQKLKLTPNEITFGPRHDEHNEALIKEKLVEQYHNQLKIIQDIIRENIDKEKKDRTDKLNVHREEPNITDETYARVRTRQKSENPYKYVIPVRDKRNKELQVHTDNLQRPRKNYKKKKKKQNDAVSVPDVASSGLVSCPSTDNAPVPCNGPD